MQTIFLKLYVSIAIANIQKNLLIFTPDNKMNQYAEIKPICNCSPQIPQIPEITVFHGKLPLCNCSDFLMKSEPDLFFTNFGIKIYHQALASDK
jgi:hypothetical protein